MKLFLASAADKTLSLLQERVPNIGKKVLFITNAADPYPEPHWWVERDRDKFKELGFELNTLDLRSTTAAELKTLIEQNNILHICGGSVYYLIALIREKEVEGILTEAVKSGAVVYTGTSAGAIIPSANIKAFSYDEDEAGYIKKVPDHTGLGIINFGIVPHCNNDAFVNEHKKMVERMPSDPTALFYLQDHQALWIDGAQMEFLESK